MTPEQELWQAIIERALMDAFWEGEERNKEGQLKAAVIYRDQAKEWLMGRSKDFRAVCDLAGIDPQYLSNAFAAGRVDKDAFFSEESARRRTEWLRQGEAA